MMASELSLVATPPARFRGEQLLELPSDLYIPPDALQVFLGTFEGPLDLLLYLIRKHNLDVLDIPMAELTRQYMGYVEVMREHRLELAAEYLLMAAFLIEVKSRMLLPRPRSDSLEVLDPRAELVRRLLEYEKMKSAAQRLDAVPQAGRDFSVVQVWVERSIESEFPQLSTDDLRAAWLGLISRARMTSHHHITRERLSVREFMSKILRRLHDVRFVRFEDLFEISAEVPILVVTFLALLELSRESLVELTQQGIFSPIYVRLCHESA
jgi:segregation and condensation protein A